MASKEFANDVSFPGIDNSFPSDEDGEMELMPGEKSSSSAGDSTVESTELGYNVGAAPSKGPQPRYTSQDLENLFNTMKGISTSLEEFESGAFDEPGSFCPDPSESHLSHQLDTLNRRIDAEYQTDVFRVKGHVQLKTDVPEVYTRKFEPIGDWVPNMLVGDQDGPPVFVEAQFNTVIRQGPWEIKFAKSREQTPLGFERYLTMNGKTLFVRNPQRVEMPVFATFRDCDEYARADLRAVKVNATIREVKEKSVPLSKPLSVPELFLKAVQRGARAKRGVTQLQLFPYVRPTLADLGGSDQAREYISSSWADVSQVAELVDRTYKEILLELVEEFRINLRDDHPDGEALRKLWDKMTDKISDDIKEPEAKIVYFKILDSISGGKYDTDAVMTATEEILFPSRSPSDAVHNTCLEVHIDGKPYYVNAKVKGQYSLLRPYSFVPAGANADLTALLATLPSFINEGMRVKYASYLVTVEILARSTTPRSEEGGAGDGKARLSWFEPMTATVLYNGPIFTGKCADQEWLNSWCIAFNSAFLDGVVRSTLKTEYLQVMRPIRPKKAPHGMPTPSFIGVGLRGGQVVDSEVRDQRVKWNSHFATDLRLRIPIPLITALLSFPECLELVDIETYFNGERPLTIRARAQNGDWTEHLYHSQLEFLGTEDGSAVVVQGPVAGPFDNIVNDIAEEEVELSNKASDVKGKTRERQSTSKMSSVAGGSGVPPPIYRASGRDFKDVKYFSHNSLGYKPGDWPKAFQYFQSKGQKIDILRELYTIHWLTANEGFTHPITDKHNPLWTTSLKGKDKMVEHIERVSNRVLAANPNLQINGEGCQAIPEKNEASFRKADERRNREVDPLYRYDEGRLWSAPFPNFAASFGRGRGRGRGGRGRAMDPGMQFLDTTHDFSFGDGPSNRNVFHGN